MDFHVCEKLAALLDGHTLMIGGHRGFSSNYPENTLPAIRAAAELGVDLIEFDVYQTLDGVPVLAHDVQLERCTDGHGLIYDRTLAELQKLDFGSFMGPAFAGTRIVTLEEVFLEMRSYPDVLMDVDIKVAWGDLSTARKAVELARKTGVLDRCVFNSIDCDVVALLYDLIGRRVIGAPDDYRFLRNFRPGPGGTLSQLWGVCVPFRQLTLREAERYRSLGITVVCTPADSPAQVEHALRCGVMLPLCNDPRRFLAVRADPAYLQSVR